MKELELFDRAMNVGYNMLLGKENTFEPNDSDGLLEYFESTEEYEKCANIKSIINNIKVLNILI